MGPPLPGGVRRQRVVLLQPAGPQVPQRHPPQPRRGSGYWKATGTDKPIHDDGATGQAVGVKKALVFYKGRPPKGTKTSWIMHEYRLAAADPLAAAVNTYRPVKFRNVSMRLDDWVLCRIYKKTGMASPMMAPPLIDYDHMVDHDDLSSGTHDHAAAAVRGRLPTIPPISDLFDDYAFAQMFDTEAEHLAVHPSLNQLLSVDGDSAVHRVEPSYYAPSSSSPAGSTGKREAASPEECDGAAHQSSAKRLKGSCFDAPQQSARGLQPASVMLGGLNHQMLPQF
ncbi:hypothetical protein ACQ4PT_063587 [Festuca glaucescens]